MSMDQEALERLSLATRLHGAATIVLEYLLTPRDSHPPTLLELHCMCSIAERVERMGDVMGPDDELFEKLLQQLMSITSDVRAHVDVRIDQLMRERASRADPAEALRVIDQIEGLPPESGDEMSNPAERDVLQRDPDESDDAFKRRRTLFENGGRLALDVADLTTEEVDLLSSQMSGRVTIDEPRFETFDMQAAMGLSDRDYKLMRLKWALVRDINLMLEDAQMNEAALAETAGEDAAQVHRWLRGMVRDVTLDTLAVLYDTAAEKAQWPSLEWIIDGSKRGGDGSQF